jgi:hypothetical protein
MAGTGNLLRRKRWVLKEKLLVIAPPMTRMRPAYRSKVSPEAIPTANDAKPMQLR